MEPRKKGITSGCRRRGEMRKATPDASPAREATGPGAVADPGHARTHFAREPGDPSAVWYVSMARPHREVRGRTPMMYDRGKSHSVIVPGKPPNKPGSSGAEAVEERALAKGNLPGQDTLRTQSRLCVPSLPEQVRCGMGVGDCATIACRHYPRQEPDAVVPHVRVRAGGTGQPVSLPRPR